MERLRYFRTRRAGHFATFVSPARKLPAFGLLLDLTSRNTQPIWSRQVFGLPACKPTPQAEGLGCVPKRSQGGARRAGDMSGGTYPIPAASACNRLLQNPALLGLRRLDHVLHRRFWRHFVVVPELADDIFQGAGLGRLERHILGNGRNQAT